MSEIMRDRYYSYIESALTSLQERLAIRVASNLTDLHVRAESIMVPILDAVFGLNLVNANITSPYTSAFDLIDESSRTIVQVSTDSSRNKIQSSLKKKGLAEYSGYRMRFVFLVPRRPSYRDIPFDNPHQVAFDPKEDVFDLGSLMSRVEMLPISDLQSVYDSVRREIRLVHTDTGVLARELTDVVRALKREDPTEIVPDPPIAFRIDEKIKMNSLVRSAQDIQELAALTYPLEGIYAQYESEGVGRARSVFRHLQVAYRQSVGKGLAPDDAYDETIHTIVDELCGDSRLAGYTYEDVELYVAVVVVDAFMRCKLFDGPDVWEAGDAHAALR